MNDDAQSSDTATEEHEQLLVALRQRVAQRRAEGAYPEGLEEELESHFRRIAHHRLTAATDQVRVALDAFDAVGPVTMPAVGNDSSIPGGELIHKATSRAVARQLEPVVAHLQRQNNALRAVIDALVDAVVDPRTHTHGELTGRVDAIVERLNSYERAPVEDAVALADLRRRIEQLERANTNA